MTEQRDLAGDRLGRRAIAAIGIDRYHHWPHLGNAVSDALGAVALFKRLGFTQIVPPLLDDAATGRALHSLVTDDLKVLGPDDSLVLFYAGHGGTRRHSLGDRVIKTGSLIPVDASDSPDRASTWIDLEGWLRAVALLPARHILVVLDACHSGIALDPILKWRDIGTWRDEPLPALQARRSRRIITSALDDQLTLDGGPVHGHSLFTGCLVEALSHGLRQDGRQVTTGSELGVYVQRRVEAYPESRQTPDFGTFAFDDRGEMLIPLLLEPVQADRTPSAPSTSPASGPVLLPTDSDRQRPEPSLATPVLSATPLAQQSGLHARASRDTEVHGPEPSPGRPAQWRTAMQTVKRIGIIVGATLVTFLLCNFGLVGLIAVVITMLLTVTATVVKRSTPAALVPLRVLSEQMPRRGGWRALVVTAVLIAAGAGMARYAANQACSDELAAAEALQKASDRSAAQVFAEAKTTCASVGRQDEVSLAMQAANGP